MSLFTGNKLKYSQQSEILSNTNCSSVFYQKRNPGQHLTFRKRFSKSSQAIRFGLLYNTFSTFHLIRFWSFFPTDTLQYFVIVSTVLTRLLLLCIYRMQLVDVWRFDWADPAERTVGAGADELPWSYTGCVQIPQRKHAKLSHRGINALDSTNGNELC